MSESLELLNARRRKKHSHIEIRCMGSLVPRFLCVGGKPGSKLVHGRLTRISYKPDLLSW